MQRYDIEETLMEKRDEGEFVKFADHQAALDAVLKEAIWAMEEVAKERLRYWSLEQEARELDPDYARTQAFLASPAVRDYRDRQEKP